MSSWALIFVLQYAGFTNSPSVAQSVTYGFSSNSNCLDAGNQAVSAVSKGKSSYNASYFCIEVK